jgi:hypothetical protein
VTSSAQAVILDDVGEFRGSADDPERGSADDPEYGDRPERHYPRVPDGHHPRAVDGHHPRAVDGHHPRAVDGHHPRGCDGHHPRGCDAEAIQVGVDPRSRAEYAADLEQRAVSGWDQRSFRSFAGERPSGASGEPLEPVRRFEPSRAGLPDPGDAVTYLDAHQPERPWLGAARGRPPEVQRLFAALDQGGGHGHIRHEGWVTEEMNRRRAACLEDPAQLDPEKREAGIDGFRSPEKLHRCREISSRITDPDAFAVAFARGIEHPMVRSALETEFTAKQVPRPVSVYLSDLLGPEGHRYCTGWRLQPVEGSMKAARDNRAAWVDAHAHDRDTDVPEPNARPIETFAGGVMVFAFGPTPARDGYEVVTMYPRPPEDEQQGDRP